MAGWPSEAGHVGWPDPSASCTLLSPESCRDGIALRLGIAAVFSWCSRTSTALLMPSSRCRAAYGKPNLSVQTLASEVTECGQDWLSQDW